MGRTDLNGVLVCKRSGSGNAFPVNESTVLAAQVLEHGA